MQVAALLFTEMPEDSLEGSSKQLRGTEMIVEVFLLGEYLQILIDLKSWLGRRVRQNK